MWFFAAIVALAGLGVTPAAAQSSGIEDRIEQIQSLEVREAVEQIADSWPQIIIVASGIILVLLFAAGVLRPGGFKKSGIRDVKPMPSPMWLFAGMMVLLAYPVVHGTIANAEWLHQSFRKDSLEMQVISQGGAALAAITIGLCLFWVMAKTVPQGGLSVGVLDCMMGVLCFLIALPLVQLAGMGSAALYEQIMGEPPARLAHQTLELIVEQRDHPWAIGLIAVVVLGVPVMEELVFRAGLQSALLRLTGSPWPSVLLTSLIFTALHYGAIPDNGWNAFGQLFVLSVCIGIAYERTRKLGVPIAMHAAFNALTIGLALLSGDPQHATQQPATDVPGVGG
jgi:membrane protease YdiL (CAAX protease family)